MRFLKSAGLLVLAGATLAPMPMRALASSHREAPLITTMPKTDGTDFYMFRSYEPGRDGFVTMVANYQPLEDPFAAVDRELMACPLGKSADAIVIDIHGEATSEKQAFGHFCDGRASLVVGTHTHVPTADLRVLPGGTAFMSDVGMTGDYDSVIGMSKDEPMQRFLQRISSARFEPATGAATLCAVAVETDPVTGLATRVGAVRLGGCLEQASPAFWS